MPLTFQYMRFKVFYPLVFLPSLSSAFVPTETMPAALRIFAENQPVTSIVETLRALLDAQPVGNSVWVVFMMIPQGYARLLLVLSLIKPTTISTTATTIHGIAIASVSGVINLSVSE